MSIVTTESLKAFYLITLTISAFACLSLILNATGERRIKVALLLLCGFISLFPLNAYLWLAFGEHSSVLLNMASVITWLYGPLVYFSLKEISLKPLTYKRLALHLLPFFIALLLQLIVLPERMLYKPRSIGFDIYHFLCLQVSAYLIHAGYWLVTNLSKAKRATKHYKNSTYYWFSYLVVCLTGLMIYDIILINGVRTGAILIEETLKVSSSVLCIFVCSFSLFSLYQPAIFDLKNTNKARRDTSSEQGTAIKEPATSVELRKIELNPDIVIELRHRLSELVLQYQPHLDPDISMSKLSSLLGITNHQLSELLNVHMETNFYAYLNTIRYEMAKKLITQKSSLSINDISYQAGFNNKNSFYKVFKENTGMTPVSYRKSQHK